MATEEDRSLGGGMSLPMWMRTRSRLHDRLDFDQSTFSPPENDDNFLYIRYPKPATLADSTDSKTITVSDSTITTNTRRTNKVDISKHTAPCKDYILGIKEPAQSQILNSNGKVKSAGTDDGFKGEAAACGTSVIRVASQMVSSGKVVKGFESFEEEEKDHMLSIGFDPKLRRGSRSLPASPLQSPNASPKSKRKLVNKYFTGAYADDKKPGSILANLLAKRDQNLSRSVTSISEEHSITEAAIKLQSISFDEADKKATPKPKPSHLREMNFWSPTSM